MIPSCNKFVATEVLLGFCKICGGPDYLHKPIDEVTNFYCCNCKANDRKLCKCVELEKDYPETRSEPNKLTQIETDRGKVYGDPKISHTAIGYAWRGIIQNRFHDLVIPELPADLVAEMLAAFKLVRLSRPLYHQDSADDLHVYVSFSERFRRDTMEPNK